MAVSSAGVRAVMEPACARLEMPIISSWTGGHADTLRQALRMTNESFAYHLDVAVRTVAYWRQRPDTIPRQQMQEILDTALERASDRDKAQFARLVAEARGTPSGPLGSGRQSTLSDFDQDGARLPADSGPAVALLEGLTGADMADRLEVAQARWFSGTAPSVITGYLFSSQIWHHDESLPAAPSTAAERIRAVVRHLMDIDFQFGGGYVRRMLLFYFQSEIVPLLHEQHPEPVRREIFSAAAEVAELPALLFAEPVFA